MRNPIKSKIYALLTVLIAFSTSVFSNPAFISVTSSNAMFTLNENNGIIQGCYASMTNNGVGNAYAICKELGQINSASLSGNAVIQSVTGVSDKGFVLNNNTGKFAIFHVSYLNQSELIGDCEYGHF